MNRKYFALFVVNFAAFLFFGISSAHAISNDDLIGSTWVCAESDGDSRTIEFEPSGMLTSIGRDKYSGTWLMKDKSIEIVVNNYLTFKGTFANNKYMSGPANSKNGNSFSWKCKLQ